MLSAINRAGGYASGAGTSALGGTSAAGTAGLRSSSASERPNAASFIRSAGQEPLRAGFGDNTISQPGAAFSAISEGLSSGRQVVEKTRALRERQEARREEAARASEQRRERLMRTERAVPNPAVQARNYVNSINQAAGAALARVNGEPPPAEPARASIAVNGEQIPVRTTAQGGQSTAPPGSTLNIRV